MTTGLFQWTPGYEQAGDYTLHFGVKDPSGLTDATDVIIHVENVDRPPVLAISDHGAVIGRPLQFALGGSDPDLGTTLTYSAAGLPDGATLDPQTGVFKWTPAPGQAGDYVVAFSVSDGEAITSRRFTDPSGA